MQSFLWIVSLLLGIPSALLIALNWVSLVGYAVASWRGHKGSHSFCPPFLCGVAGTVACLLYPHSSIWRWAWLPLLLDPSIGLLLFMSVLHLVGRLSGRPSPFDREAPHPPSERPPA